MFTCRFIWVWKAISSLSLVKIVGIDRHLKRWFDRAVIDLRVLYYWVIALALPFLVGNCFQNMLVLLLSYALQDTLLGCWGLMGVHYDWRLIFLHLALERCLAQEISSSPLLRLILLQLRRWFVMIAFIMLLERLVDIRWWFWTKLFRVNYLIWQLLIRVVSPGELLPVIKLIGMIREVWRRLKLASFRLGLTA